MSFVKKSPNYLSSRAQNFKGELWDLFIIIRIREKLVNFVSEAVNYQDLSIFCASLACSNTCRIGMYLSLLSTDLTIAVGVISSPYTKY